MKQKFLPGVGVRGGGGVVVAGDGERINCKIVIPQG